MPFNVSNSILLLLIYLTYFCAKFKSPQLDKTEGVYCDYLDTLNLHAPLIFSYFRATHLREKAYFEQF